AACATAPDRADYPSEVASLIRYEQLRPIEPRPLRVHLAIADMGSGLVRLETPIVPPPRSSPASEAALADPVAIARRARSLLLVNASGFRVQGYAPGKHPLTYLPGMAVDIPGLAVHDGREASPANPSAAQIWTDDTGRVDAGSGHIGESVTQAACGYSMLVEAGASVAAADPAIAARTAIGQDAEGRLLFVVVEGGDGEGSAGVTLRELALIMQDLGSLWAINMDGGGSSVMILGFDGAQRVVSRGEERLLGVEIPRRPIPNAVVLLRAAE
ncbi:MAG: phosphodiester glycosidase family protein, partial [Spirochaetaceae bacterium]|nr:phosphodiester glycosidase family protein [Spirochaetaceae bacterium]